MRLPFSPHVIPLRFQDLEQIFEQQAHWAAKGGRGRKKPKRISAWTYLHKRKRGRPTKPLLSKVAVVAGKRKSKVDQLDKKIILDLIREAPERPEMHIRALIAEAIRDIDFDRFQHLRNFQHRSDGQHIRRILSKADRVLPILRLPNKRYLIETKL